MPGPSFILRAGDSEDAPALREIMNREIAQGVATWRDETMDMAQMRDWIAARAGPRRALIVAESDGAVAGFAAYGSFRALGGYRHTVENSIYIAQGAQGRGIGGALMKALLARAEADDLRAMVALIGAENTGSIAFHKRHGFVECGHMPQVGRKFGRWLDLALLQRMLGTPA